MNDANKNPVARDDAAHDQLRITETWGTTPLAFKKRPTDPETQNNAKVDDGQTKYSKDSEDLEAHTSEWETALDKLKKDLELHFQKLKREYEALTGKQWTPLERCPTEEYPWDWEEDEEDEE